MAYYEYYRRSTIESNSLNGVDVDVAAADLEIALERENAAILQYCVVLGGYAVSSFADVNIPWANEFLRRPQAKRLLATMVVGDVVIAHSLSRVFSSSHDAAATISYFRDHGLGLHIAELGGDVSSESFKVDFLCAANLFEVIEKRRSVERIKNVKKEQRDKGRYLGGSRPFGYMIHSNGRLIENTMEQKILQRILGLRDQGKSLRAISDEVSTPLTPVSFKTVQRILQRNV
jgi:DNA invertase Pin-like site-specific DNA recombinase